MTQFKKVSYISYVIIKVGDYVKIRKEAEGRRVPEVRGIMGEVREVREGNWWRYIVYFTPQYAKCEFTEDEIELWDLWDKADKVSEWLT